MTLKAMRRLIPDWIDLVYDDKKLVMTNLVRYFNVNLNRGELTAKLNKLSKDEKLDYEKAKKSSVLGTLAKSAAKGAAIGAGLAFAHNIWKASRKATKESVEVKESFDSRVKWSFTKIDMNNKLIAEFKINNIPYKTSFTKEGPNEWAFEFTAENETKILGNGSANQVFSTVLDILEQCIDLVSPETVEFTADEPSRKKLYNSLIQKIKLPGYSARSNGNQFFIEQLNENASCGATSAGAVASVATPLGPVIKRNDSIFANFQQQNKKSRKKTK